jgi:hypothetical protein
MTCVVVAGVVEPVHVALPRTAVVCPGPAGASPQTFAFCSIVIGPFEPMSPSVRACRSVPEPFTAWEAYVPSSEL